MNGPPPYSCCDQGSASKSRSTGNDRMSNRRILEVVLDDVRHSIVVYYSAPAHGCKSAPRQHRSNAQGGADLRNAPEWLHSVLACRQDSIKSHQHSIKRALSPPSNKKLAAAMLRRHNAAWGFCTTMAGGTPGLTRKPKCIAARQQRQGFPLRLQYFLGLMYASGKGCRAPGLHADKPLRGGATIC